MPHPPLSPLDQTNFFFGGVDNLRWRKPVVPGDVLVRPATCTGGGVSCLLLLRPEGCSRCWRCCPGTWSTPGGARKNHCAEAPSAVVEADTPPFPVPVPPLVQMMRCDVTKFNKRFGICKVRCAAGWLLFLAAVPASCPRGLPRACCIAALRPDQHAPAWPCPPTPPSPCASYLQMMAKAYVGEDLVCEAELTLVMQPEK